MVSRGIRAASACAAAGMLLGMTSAAPATARPVEGDPQDALRPGGQGVARQVTLVQRVAKQVVLRPLDDARISAKGTDLVAISELGSYDVPQAAMRAYTH